MNNVGLLAYSLGVISSFSSSASSRRLARMSSVVSPVDCIVLGATAEWLFASVYDANLGLIPCGVNPSSLSPVAYFGLIPRYITFHLTRRHYGNSNIAFLDKHVEHGSLRA